MIGEIRIHPNITRPKRAIRCDKAGEDILLTENSALPDKHSATILEQLDLGILLISGPTFVDSEHTQIAQEIALQTLRADPEAFAIGRIVLPNEVTTGITGADARKDLISILQPRDRIIVSLADVGAPSGGRADREGEQTTNT